MAIDYQDTNTLDIRIDSRTTDSVDFTVYELDDGKIYINPPSSIDGKTLITEGTTTAYAIELQMIRNREGTHGRRVTDGVNIDTVHEGVTVGTRVNHRTLNYGKTRGVFGAGWNYLPRNPNDGILTVFAIASVKNGQLEVTRAIKQEAEFSITNELETEAENVVRILNTSYQIIAPDPSKPKVDDVEGETDGRFIDRLDFPINHTLTPLILEGGENDTFHLTLTELPNDQPYKNREVVMRQTDGDKTKTWEEVIFFDWGPNEVTVQYFYGDLPVGTYAIWQQATDADGVLHSSPSVIWHWGNPDTVNPVDYSDVTGLHIPYSELENALLDKTRIDGFNIMFGHPRLGVSVF